MSDTTSLQELPTDSSIMENNIMLETRPIQPLQQNMAAVNMNPPHMTPVPPPNQGQPSQQVHPAQQGQSLQQDHSIQQVHPAQQGQQLPPLGASVSAPPLSQSMPSSETQQIMNKVVTGIQQASAMGATQLPSRDIPLTTQSLVQDEQVQPNYVPPPPKDYIQEYETMENVVQNNMISQNRQNTMDLLYEELQVPLLVGVLYFVFQLPVFKKYMYKTFPFLFAADGNSNLYGFVFNSAMLGSSYYVLSKVMKYASSV